MQNCLNHLHLQNFNHENPGSTLNHEKYTCHKNFWIYGLPCIITIHDYYSWLLFMITITIHNYYSCIITIYCNDTVLTVTKHNHTLAKSYCIASNYGLDISFFQAIFILASEWDRHLLVEHSRVINNVWYPQWIVMAAADTQSNILCF